MQQRHTGRRHTNAQLSLEVVMRGKLPRIIFCSQVNSSPFDRPAGMPEAPFDGITSKLDAYDTIAWNLDLVAFAELASETASVAQQGLGRNG